MVVVLIHIRQLINCWTVLSVKLAQWSYLAFETT